MKKIFISMLAIATLASCSKNGEPEKGSAAIILSAGVPTASISHNTKAPIAATNIFTAGIAGWEINTATAATPDYTQEVTWSSNAVDIVAGAAAQAITLTPSQVYNANSAVKTYIKAWYPEGARIVNAVTFTNTDGSVDAMFAPVINGTKSDRANKTLAFAHKTTQLKFMVKKGDGLADDTKIVSIKVKNAELPTGFDLANDEVTYAAAADLAVAGINGTVIGTTPAGDAAGNAVMIKPITGNTVMLDIATNNATYTGVTATIDTDINFVDGRAYTITLTFGQSELSLKASVTDWTAGTGSASVE